MQKHDSTLFEMSDPPDLLEHEMYRRTRRKHKTKDEHLSDDADLLRQEVELYEERIREMNRQISIQLELISRQSDKIYSDSLYIKQLQGKYERLKMRCRLSEQKLLLVEQTQEYRIKLAAATAVHADVEREAITPTAYQDFETKKYHDKTMEGYADAIKEQTKAIRYYFADIKRQLAHLRHVTPLSMPDIRKSLVLSQTNKLIAPLAPAINVSLTELLDARLAKKRAFELLEKTQLRLRNIVSALDDYDKLISSVAEAAQFVECLRCRFYSENETFKLYEFQLLDNISQCSDYTLKTISKIQQKKQDEVNYLECFCGIVYYVRDIARGLRDADDCSEVCNACGFDQEQRAWFEVVFYAMKRAAQL